MKKEVKIQHSDYIPWEQLTDREKAAYEAGQNERMPNWLILLLVAAVFTYGGFLLGMAYSFIKYNQQ